MGEVLNLTKARKARARAADKAEAATNRAAHGRTKPERETSDAQAEASARKLDAHKREPRNPESKSEPKPEPKP